MQRTRVGVPYIGICIGSFDVEDKIGKGGYSKVFKAKDKYTKTTYAIKIIRKVLVLHKNSINHLKKEEQIMKSINDE